MGDNDNELGEAIEVFDIFDAVEVNNDFEKAFASLPDITPDLSGIQICDVDLVDPELRELAFAAPPTDARH